MTSKPLILIPHITHCADRALETLRTLYGKPLLQGIEGAYLLSQRATLMGLQTEGQRSANGQCHLWPCQDGQWIALNLSRPQDWELLPALFQDPQSLAELSEVAVRVKQYPSGTLVQQGRILGLAIAKVAKGQSLPGQSWFKVAAKGPDDNRQRQAPPRVVDLSSLWAGPLCSHLLQQCGAHVIKVESVQRPDGARLNQQPGASNFYQQLHQHKTLYVLDFHSASDIQKLHSLIEQADVVIEGSRPRALQQLGIDAEKIIARSAGKIWVSITAYGRSTPEAHWIGYGDDVAAAAGLCHWKNNKPEFIGDAIADPLTGLHAALAAYTLWQEKSSALLDINLHNVSRYCATSMET